MEPADFSVVTDLHKKESKFDVVIKGTVYRFEVGACGEGFAIRYFIEAPNPIAQMMGLPETDPRSKTKRVVLEHHVHPRFYEKLFKINIKPRVIKESKKIHQDLLDSVAQVEAADAIENELAVQPKGASK